MGPESPSPPFPRSAARCRIRPFYKSYMPYRSLSATELVRACVDSADQEAWGEFVRRFQPVIAGVALRTARRWGEASPLVIEDLVQEAFMKLCGENRRLLREFQPQHEKAFYGYLKVVTTRVVHDYFKRSHAVKRRSADPSPRSAAEDEPPELIDLSATEQIERHALFGEIDELAAKYQPPSTTPNSGGVNFTLLPNEDLKALAKRVTGNEDNWQRIAKDNGLASPTDVQPFESIWVSNSLLKKPGETTSATQ